MLDSKIVSPTTPSGTNINSFVPGYRKHDVEIPSHIVVSPGVTHLNLSSEGMQLLHKMSREEQDTFLEF